MRIGAQVPMAGGLICALTYALNVGCEAMQIFAKSPRRWEAPALDPRTCAQFRAGCQEAGIDAVFTHASYLINMGAEDPLLWERSILALADELLRAGQVGAQGLVVHLGRRFSDDDEASIARVAAAALRASEIAREKGETPLLLLENSAGAGRQFGVTLPEMTQALQAVRAEGVPSGLCIDTCHALAGGIDVRSAAAWDALTSSLTAGCGDGCVRLVHANDCKGEIGSHKDRHEWIGDGHIGEEGFHAMFGQQRLASAAVVVEMPGEGPDKDSINISRLRALRDAGEALSDRNPTLF